MSNRQTWLAYYHLTWATKFRRPIITPSVEYSLFPFIVKRAETMGVYVHALDGWSDHVHLVISIPPELAVAHVVQQIKGSSSYHVNQLQLCSERFRWQTGYYLSTVSPRNLPIAVAYVKKQKEHHTKKTIHPALEPDDFPDDQPLESKSIIRESTSEYSYYPRAEARGENELIGENLLKEDLMDTDSSPMVHHGDEEEFDEYPF